MSNLPPKNSSENKVSLVQKLISILRRLTHNWGWKLLSLLLAIFLWGVLVTQDETLPRSKRFNDVSITALNASLESRGLIVVSDLDALPVVDIVVELPQKNYASATANRYIIRADFQQISGPGQQTLHLSSVVNNSNLYGSVKSISPSTITVTVENYITRELIPVNIKTVGQLPEGLDTASLTAALEQVKVSGPESIVDSISYCQVEVDLQTLNPQPGTQTRSYTLTFIDQSGNIISDTAKLTAKTERDTKITHINVTADLQALSEAE